MAIPLKAKNAETPAADRPGSPNPKPIDLDEICLRVAASDLRSRPIEQASLTPAQMLARAREIIFETEQQATGKDAEKLRAMRRATERSMAGKPTRRKPRVVQYPPVGAGRATQENSDKALESVLAQFEAFKRGR